MIRTDVARLADGPYLSAGVWQLVVPIPVHRQSRNGCVTTHLLAGPVAVAIAEPSLEVPPGPAVGGSR